MTDIEIFAAGLLTGLITFPILWMLIINVVLREGEEDL